jgi:uncharacterized membrane protein YphA (DoxX/SURF4 family)
LAVGITAITQGGVYLINGDGPALKNWLFGLLTAVSGISLLVGFVTPFASGLIALTTICIALSWFPAPNPDLFTSPLATVLVVIIGAAVVVLGPGAISIDCRLFGRREIIIPHASRTPRA